MRMKVNVKALLLIALLSFCALQVVVGKEYQKRWRETDDRGISPVEEEEWRAAEDEKRRQEKIQEEEEDFRKHHPHRKEDPEEEEDEGERGREREPRGEDIFLLGEGKRVVKSEAGEMRVVKGYGYGGGRYGGFAGSAERPLHLGFIAMEPRSLFVPQYWDSSFVLFIQRGEAKLGYIYKDALVERTLKTGDIYRVPAGSAFYIVSTHEGQRLHAICSIDPSESLGLGLFQTFFIGGGSNPKTVLAGFDADTLSTAMNVSIGELKDLMTSQESGPFVYIDSHVPTPYANFDSLTKEDRQRKLESVMPVKEVENEEEDEEDDGDNEKPVGWSLRKVLNGLLWDNGKDKGKKGDREGDVGNGPNPFNLYKADPSFKNKYGSTLAVDKHVYKPLKKSDLGVYYVNLTAGTMLAPHVNPVAAEYGVVLRGSGTIQIVYPNGTTALNAKVREGSVFWVPRYFAFCHMASRSGPLEFFGFTTSSKRNHPQFLVGATSIFKTMWGPEFAAAFGVTEERLKIFEAQREAVALPSAGASPGDAGAGEREEEGGESEAKEETRSEKAVRMLKRIPKGMKVLGRDMVMDFE